MMVAMPTCPECGMTVPMHDEGCPVVRELAARAMTPSTDGLDPKILGVLTVCEDWSAEEVGTLVGHLTLMSLRKTLAGG